MDNILRIIWTLMLLEGLLFIQNVQCQRENTEEKSLEELLAPVLEIDPRNHRSSAPEENRRMLSVSNVEEPHNRLDLDNQDSFDKFGDDVTNYVDPIGHPPSYADRELLSNIMGQAEKANFRYPVRKHAPSEINPFNSTPKEFHSLLNIPLHVYNNGSVYNPNEKFQVRPIITSGYASMNIQGVNKKATNTEQQISTTTDIQKIITTTQIPKVVTQTEISVKKIEPLLQQIIKLKQSGKFSRISSTESPTTTPIPRIDYSYYSTETSNIPQQTPTVPSFYAQSVAKPNTPPTPKYRTRPSYNDRPSRPVVIPNLRYTHSITPTTESSNEDLSFNTKYISTTQTPLPIVDNTNTGFNKKPDIFISDAQKDKTKFTPSKQFYYPASDTGVFSLDLSQSEVLPPVKNTIQDPQPLPPAPNTHTYHSTQQWNTNTQSPSVRPFSQSQRPNYFRQRNPTSPPVRELNNFRQDAEFTQTQFSEDPEYDFQNKLNVIRSGFDLPLSAANLRTDDNPIIKHHGTPVLPQFRPNVGSDRNVIQYDKKPLRGYTPNPIRRSYFSRERPSFLQRLFSRTPVNRRSGQTTSDINKISPEGKRNIEKNKNAAEYLLKNGPVPIKAQKVVVIGPFDRPPKGAPLIIPHKNIPAKLTNVNMSPNMTPPPPRYSHIPHQHVMNGSLKATLMQRPISNEKSSLRSRIIEKSDKPMNMNVFSPVNKVSRHISAPPTPPVGNLSLNSLQQIKRNSLRKGDLNGAKKSQVVYGRPYQKRISVNSDITTVNIGSQLTFSSRNESTQNNIPNLPDLIDNVKQEDKDALIAAQFYFPNLNGVQRSGQQKIIPLPVPMYPGKVPRERKIASDRRIIIDPNLAHPKKWSYFKIPNSPKNLDVFMRPPPPPYVPYDYSGLRSNDKEIPGKNTTNEDFSERMTNPLKSDFQKIDKFRSKSHKSSLSNNKNLSKKSTIKISSKISPHLHDSEKSVIYAVPEYSTSTPKKITEFDRFRVTTPLPTAHLTPTKNDKFVEPEITKESYDGWVVIDSSRPDNSNPVYDHVKENIPEIRIKEPIPNEEDIITAHPKTARFIDVDSEDDIVIGTPLKTSNNGNMVHYSSQFSVEGPEDVRKSFLIPQSGIY